MKLYCFLLIPAFLGTSALLQAGSGSSGKGPRKPRSVEASSGIQSEDISVSQPTGSGKGSKTKNMPLTVYPIPTVLDYSAGKEVFKASLDQVRREIDVIRQQVFPIVEKILRDFFDIHTSQRLKIEDGIIEQALEPKKDAEDTEDILKKLGIILNGKVEYIALKLQFNAKKDDSDPEDLMILLKLHDSAHLYIIQVLKPKTSTLKVLKSEETTYESMHLTEGKEHNYNSIDTAAAVQFGKKGREALFKDFEKPSKKVALDNLAKATMEVIRFYLLGEQVANALEVERAVDFKDRYDDGKFLIKRWDVAGKAEIQKKLKGTTDPVPVVAVLSYRPFHCARLMAYADPAPNETPASDDQKASKAPSHTPPPLPFSTPEPAPSADLRALAHRNEGIHLYVLQRNQPWYVQAGLTSEGIPEEEIALEDQAIPTQPLSAQAAFLVENLIVRDEPWYVQANLTSEGDPDENHLSIEGAVRQSVSAAFQHSLQQ
jgi:hypothetical protein